MTKSLMHLFDLTKGGKRSAACGDKSHEMAIGEDFDKLRSDMKCDRCVGERTKALEYVRTCRLCALTFANAEICAKHEEQHVLMPVSYRCEPLAFVVNAQSYYDESSRKARALAAAYEELRKWLPALRFETVPSRMMLRKERENSVIIGEAHVLDYLIVQT